MKLKKFLQYPKFLIVKKLQEKNDMQTYIDPIMQG